MGVIIVRNPRKKSKEEYKKDCIWTAILFIGGSIVLTILLIYSTIMWYFF